MLEGSVLIILKRLEYEKQSSNTKKVTTNNLITTNYLILLCSLIISKRTEFCSLFQMMILASATTPTQEK